MSSNASSTKCRSPRIVADPKRASTYGELAVEMAAGYGLEAFDWQADVLDGWLGINKRKKFTAGRCGLLVPRQNGKNAVIEIRELFGMVFLGERFLHSAHEVKTARKAFKRLLEFFDDPRHHPELAEMVKEVRRTNGQEGIELINGGSVEFVARSRGSARGYTVDVLVMDEAQELTDEQLEALLPTLSAAPKRNPQQIMTGTPPNGRIEAEAFGRMRDDAIAGKDKSLAWHEWSVEEIGDVEDRERWYECNPSLGMLISEDVVEKELKAMSPDGFARERLCWWPKRIGTKLIARDAWDKCHTTEPPADGITCYGVKFDISGKKVSLVAAIRYESGIYVEMIHDRSCDKGTKWLAQWIRERRDKVAEVWIDGRSGADALNEQLHVTEGFDSKPLSKKQSHVMQTREVATAASMMLNAMADGTLTHYGQEALTESAVNAVKRRIGSDGAYGFGGNDMDSTPIEAASIALMAATKTRRNPNRRQRLL